ncbi:DUF3040 domain-containing protein [Streptomyces sp. NPDC057411]|uniref:DUF3040 domain-containing protein n=1 Tax=unclassified Streptomyces TaxID=2593676 RepID=UPI0036443098
MDEVRLSAHERRVLAEIEEVLRRDGALDRRLRSMRRGFVPSAPAWLRALRRRLLTLGVILAFAGSAALVVPAAGTGRPDLVWAFAGAWALAMAGLAVLVVRWCRRWALFGR